MDVVDITFVGSGIASTATLIALFKKLLGEAPAEKLKITVIEKGPEFWKGIPYGSRSSVNALTITCVKDFVYEKEQPEFFGWLKNNKDTWVNDYRSLGGLTAERWLNNNLPLIAAEDWGTVYIPRFIFGRYLHQKVTGLLKQVEERGVAEVKLISAEAIDADLLIDGLYSVKLAHPDGTLTNITSRKLVIATGSAPVKTVTEMVGSKAIYVNDIYQPSVNANIEKLQTALFAADGKADNNVLIIGSNASSIELLYLIEGMPQLREAINKIVVISPSGALPYHISTEVLPEHPIPNLEKLKAEGSYTIKTLVDAAGLDLNRAVKNGANVAYIATIIGNTLKLMETLDKDSKKEFFGIHGMYLSNLFRRSGPEYKAGSQLLIDLNEVVFLRGKFIDTSPTDDGVQLNYLDVATGQQQTYPLNFKAVINCSGSNYLNQSASRLIYNIVQKKLAKVNLSGKGFEVNEKFEAAPNLYVTGPLLGGNMNKLIHFWHLENASRLTYLAPYLADELASY